MSKISYYIAKDLLKNKAITGYFLLMILSGWGAFVLESQAEKTILLIMQLTLFFVPLITMVFSAVYYYNSLEFIVSVLSQPVSRSKVIHGIYTGLNVCLVSGFVGGIGIPLIIYYPAQESFLLMISGSLLIMIFTALALLISLLFQDKSKGIGVVLLLWAFFAFVFDGILLFLMYQFSEYPIERIILGISFLNPVDIARIAIIMKTEASAMLGLSGAIFREFFGSAKGTTIAFIAMIVWIIIPFILTSRVFLKRDF